VFAIQIDDQRDTNERERVGNKRNGFGQITASVKLDTFHLTSQPDPVTLSVTVDDIPLSAGWYYDEEANAIRFDSEAIPAPGAHIVVEFMLAGDCEA
jgi:hypothetical protein